MRTIWKIPLRPGVNQLWVSGDVEPLTAQLQDGHIYLWAIVEKDAPIQPFAIYVVGTGHDLIDAPMTYISTVQMPSEIGTLVWHVFQVPVDTI